MTELHQPGAVAVYIYIQLFVCPLNLSRHRAVTVSNMLRERDVRELGNSGRFPGSIEPFLGSRSTI